MGWILMLMIILNLAPRVPFTKKYWIRRPGRLRWQVKICKAWTVRLEDWTRTDGLGCEVFQTKGA